MERRIATRGIIEKNGKILAVKLKGSDGKAVDFWAIPGGGLDPLESLHDGLTREMVEETGIVPKIGSLFFVQQYHVEKREHLEFFFHITNAEDYERIDLAATTHGNLELARVEFIDPQKETILPEFLQTINVAEFIADNHPTLIKSYL